jgi:hypothetical protein
VRVQVHAQVGDLQQGGGWGLGVHRSGEAGQRLRAKARVEQIAQAIAQQVQAQHGQRNRHAGPHGQQRGLEHEGLGVAEHAAPRGLRRLCAQAQVRQRRLGQDGNGKLHRGLHDQHRGDVGQHMLERDAHAALAAGTRRQNEIARPHGIGRGARHPRKGGNIEDANGDDRIDDARAKHRRHHDGRQNGRKGKREVGQAHDGFFHPAAPRGGQQPQRRAQAHANAHRDHAHQQRVACAHQQQRRHVAAKGVGAQPVLGAGRLQLGGQVHFVGRPGRPDQRQRRCGQQQRHQQGARNKAAVPQGTAQPVGA